MTASKRIGLIPADIAMGLALSRRVAEARARAQAFAEAEQLFAAQMLEKYEIGDGYTLRNWLHGFEPVAEEQEAEDGDTG